MLRFAVQEEPGTTNGWSLRHANLVGPDDVAMGAEITFRDGVIDCEKRSADAAGISLQFPVGGVNGGPDFGNVTLQTTLLPARQRPYLLSLELARSRIMLILNKLEDWALFDLPADHPAMQLFERAREAFTRAVVATGGDQDGVYSMEAEQLAREALAMAMEAGEAITLLQAKRQLSQRMSGELYKAAEAISAPSNAITDHEAKMSRNALIGSAGVILPTPPQVGVAIAPDQFSPSLQRVVQDGCDFIRMPMRWVDMEPSEGRYLFGKTDRWIEWAVRHGKIPVIGGPVIDFKPRSVPEWLYIWEHDYETLRELVHEHVKQLVTRYRRTVQTWTVVSGLHVNRNFALTFEQVLDLTRLCVNLVRKLQPSARIQVEIDQPWGEYVAASARGIPPALYAEMLDQAGLSVDLIGLRIEMGQPEPGRCTRDMMALSALLDRFATLEKPITLSAVSVPSKPPEPESLGLGGQLEPGFWRSGWSTESQKAWMSRALLIAASKPFVHNVCWSELYDPSNPAHNHEEGLVDATGQPKASLKCLADIRQKIGEGSPDWE